VSQEKRIVGGSIALALILYLVLIVAILPARTFFDSDPGVKFIQVENLVAYHWQGMWIEYRGEALDPLHKFSPFNTSFFYEDPRNHKIYGVYSIPFVLVASFLYKLIGFHGLYLLPCLSTLATMWVTYRLSKCFCTRFVWLAPLLVGFLSPLLFYSVDFWEHSPAVLLASLSIWWLVEGLAHGQSLWLVGAGLAMGLATCFRAEAYAMIPACGLAFIWARRRRLSALLAYGTGLALILLPFWVFQWHYLGTPVGPHLHNAVVPQVSGQVAHNMNLHPLVFWAYKFLAATGMLLPWRTSTSWTVLVLGLISLRLLIALVPTWRRVLSLLLAIGMCSGVTWVVVVGVRGHWFAHSMVQGFPIVLFSLFLGLVPSLSPSILTSPRSRSSFPLRGLVLIGVVFTTLVLLTAPSSGGPQWGARFLLPVYPLLVVLLIYTLQCVLGAPAGRTLWDRVLLVTFALLCLASALTQFEGVRRLYWSKADYERLTQAVEELSPETVVTDIWWLPAMTATSSEQKTWFLVKHGRNGSLSDMLSVLHQQGVAEFTYVTTPEDLKASASDLVAAYLTEQARRTERIWLDVEFVTYALTMD